MENIFIIFRIAVSVVEKMGDRLHVIHSEPTGFAPKVAF